MTRKINAILFIAVIFLGCIYALYQLWHDQKLVIPSDVSPLNGEITHILDKRISDAAPKFTSINHVINGSLYAITQDADSQIRAGCGNWLFLTEELITTQDGEKNAQQRLMLIQSIIQKLHQANITLISIPVPDKAQQQATHLCGLRMSDQAKSRHDTWFALSQKLPLIQIDLQQQQMPLSYWITDTHWDRAGAQRAAHFIQRQLQSVIQAPALSMQLQTNKTAHERIGDLTTLARIDQNPPPFAPKPDLEKDTSLTILRSGGLLDDTPAPNIVLTGSSYSLNSGFIDYLQYEMRQEILQKSVVGSGFAGSLLSVLKNLRMVQDIQYIIWEWPLRALYQPLTDDERYYLQEIGVQS